MLCILAQNGMAGRELSNLLSTGRVPEARWYTTVDGAIFPLVITLPRARQ
jgi:hypothetical protein